MQVLVLLIGCLVATSKACCVAAADTGYNETMPEPGAVYLLETTKATSTTDGLPVKPVIKAPTPV